MKRTTRKEKFNYWFDNQMSSGILTLIKMLTVLTILAIIIIGVLIAFVDSDSGHNIAHGIWESLNHIIDPGQLGEDEGGFVYLFTLVIVTFIGLLLTSTLIGIISNAIDDKIRDLQRGKSNIIEENHVIVLGMSNGIYTIVSELIEANSNQKDEVLVIMDDKETKDVMDNRIRQRFPNTGPTRVICRNGSIADISDLRVCSLETCRSVIVNADNDAMTIKSILAVVKLLKEYDNHSAYIVAVIRQEQNIEAAEVAGEGFVEIINYKDVMARIIAHTNRNAGLSKVYTEIFDFEGSEFYLEEHPQMVGVTMAELNLYFPYAIVIGIQRKNGTIMVNPPLDTTVETGDKLILFAEDDGITVPLEQPVKVDIHSVLGVEIKEKIPHKDILILGYDSKIDKILMEEDNYVAKGSTATIAFDESEMRYKSILESIQLNNLHIEVKVCDIYNRDVLEKIIQNKSSILVLANSVEEMTTDMEEKVDAKILLLLLQLKYLVDQKDYKLNVTSEMLRVENQELAQIAQVNDFIISSNMTSLILAQVCQSRDLIKIFNELLTDEGSEIYVRPAKNYISLEDEVDMYTAGVAVSLHQEVLIGYRFYHKDTEEYEIVTNPEKAIKHKFSPEDAFIVIAID